MSLNLNTIFEPVSPQDFYGLRDIVADFNDTIERRKREDYEINSFLLLGHEGTGKSSLLRKLESTISGRKDITAFFNLVPEEEELKQFFITWKNQIDELSPEWRSLLEKVGKKKLGDDLPSLGQEIKLPSNKTYTEHYVDLFFENLDKINQKLDELDITLYFFIDNFHLFKLMDIQGFYSIFATIVKELAVRKYNIVVISAFNDEYIVDFDYEKYLTNYSTILKVEHLSVSEAEIYLRRKAPGLMSKGLLDLVTNSQRSFFDLNLGVAFLEKGLGMNDFVVRDIRKLLDLTKEQEDVLLEMASYNENLFPIDQLIAYVSLEAIKSLEEKGILWMSKTHVWLLQESLLTTMKFRVRLFGPLTSLMIKLDSISQDLEKAIAPSSRTIEEVGELTLKIRERLADFAVASKIRQISNTCIKKGIFQAAYDFSLINAQQFEHINELEQAGGFCERIAREFEEKNYYFAARLYVKSADYYTAVNEDLKAKRSYARAADQFEKLALSLPIEKSEYAVRGYLKWSLDCYRNMADGESFERIKNKAIELYDNESIHHNYFKSMKFVTEREVQVPDTEKTSEDLEDVTLENLEKELDF